MKLNLLPTVPPLGPLRKLLPDMTSRATDQITAPRLRTPRRSRTDSFDRIALTEVAGHLTYTARTVTAWYTVEEHVWPFQSDMHREAVIEAIAAQYAALAGMHVTIRRTTVPFPAREWAATLTRNAQPLPDAPLFERSVTGADLAELRVPTWENHVDNAVAQLDDWDYVSHRTQVGVTFNRPGRGADAALARRVDEITESLAQFGFRARPSTIAEMCWMIYRSVGIGLNPPDVRPGDVDPDDIIEFTENISWARTPYSTTTQLVDRSTGQSVHVAVLTVGRMEELDIPAVHQPWAHLSAQLGYPVEWVSRINVLGPAAARGSVERRLLTIRSQRRDYADHNLPEPLHLERLAERASVIGDQLDTALPSAAARAHGWHRLAVFGESEDHCLARVRDVTRVYADKLHITLNHPRAQARLLREFIPGQPLADTGHLRRLPVRLMAAAMPQATAEVGDRQGDLIGYTATSGETPVFVDLHYPMEVRDSSGLSVFVSEPGGGKSTLLGAFGYLNARRGVRVTLLDPSGPLARLCTMPELRPFSRVVDLTGSQPGTLAPYAMIPTPARGDFPAGPEGDSGYTNAFENAAAERYWLVQDIVQMLLPAQVIDRDTMMTLRTALRAVAPAETSTLEDVAAALRAIGNPTATSIAELLLDQTRTPLGRLFFGRPPRGFLATDAKFTVITMSGLRLPEPGVDRADWTAEEAIAVPMLHLAHRLAVRRSYAGNMHERKFVGLDEGHVVSNWKSGKSFLTRLSRDSRKWNIAALLASQNPLDILGIDLQNLVSNVFVGRIVDDQAIAEQALQLLRLPTGSGYEAVLAGLSQHSSISHDRLGYREFVMRDVDGRTQKVRVDLAYVPGLLDTLNTTPGGRK